MSLSGSCPAPSVIHSAVAGEQHFPVSAGRVTGWWCSSRSLLLQTHRHNTSWHVSGMASQERGTFPSSLLYGSHHSVNGVVKQEPLLCACCLKEKETALCRSWNLSDLGYLTSLFSYCRQNSARVIGSQCCFLLRIRFQSLLS